MINQSNVIYVGKISLCWFGRRPRLIIADAELARLVLTNNKGHFVKPPRNPFVDILSLGLSSLEGESWSKRRRVVTSAFHLEKLKVIFLYSKHFPSMLFLS